MKVIVLVAIIGSHKIQLRNYFTVNLRRWKNYELSRGTMIFIVNQLILKQKFPRTKKFCAARAFIWAKTAAYSTSEIVTQMYAMGISVLD